MKVITVSNAKGGVAKTTTALCISSHIASAGHSVLVIDLDPQANISRLLLGQSILEEVEGYSLYDVLYTYTMEKKRNTLSEAIREVNPSLFLVPATLMMEKFKDVLKAQVRKPEKTLETLLKPFKKQFDYVVIDCPADLSIYVESAIEVSDMVICPTTYDILGLGGLTQVIPTILEFKGDDFQDYRVLFTQFNSRATKVQESLKQYVDELDELGVILPFHIPIAQGIKNAQAEKADFMQDKPYTSSAAHEAYKQLANYILEYTK